MQHGSEIEFLNTLLIDLESSPPTQTAQIVQKIKNRIYRLETGNEPADLGVPFTSRAQHDTNPTGERTPGITFPGATQNTSHESDSSILTEIEHLAWGRNSAGCFPHKTCSCQYHRGDVELVSATNFPQGENIGAKRPLFFPSTKDARTLVNFHIRHLAWHHNSFHSPTFLEQCERFWQNGLFDHPLWQALYFSVLSFTVGSIQDSAKARSLVDVNLSAVPSVKQLFSSMVEILYRSDFLTNLSLYSIQSIVISTEVAHNLGLSQLNATLFNAGVRIAECLGIHKIQPHLSGANHNKEAWEEKIEREVGRRVWCQMIIQDHFAIPFTDSYSISPTQFSTDPPMNADDHDLQNKPFSIPTITTYIRVLVTLAELMPQLVNGLGPMKARKPIRQQYEHILHIDLKMRAVVKDIPSFLLRPDKDKEERIPWLGIARRSLAITAAEKIIMIHRPFLFRSFRDQTYKYTRRTCVAAAMTILREHEVIVREEDISIWTHTAFAITAAVIMCFELISTAESHVDIAQTYSDAIYAARTRLSARNHDVLAQRGVALIDAIFTADPFMSSSDQPGRMIDFPQILAKFSTFTKSKSGSDAPETLFSGFSDVEFDDVIGAHLDQMQPAWDTAEDIDFDAWFSGTFYSLHDPCGPEGNRSDH